MGRQVKQRRLRQNRKNPIMPQANGASDGSLNNNASILNKLTSPDQTERAWAATAISQLILEDEPRQILLHSSVVPKLLCLIADPSPLVIVEALGALRNLAIVDESTCYALQETDILSGLKSLAINVMNRIELIRLNPQTELAENELNMEQIFQMAEQIFGLLWSLIEISGEALALGIELISHLLFFFSKDTAAPQVTREVMGQVILLCVEDNQPTAQILQVMKSVMDDDSEPISLRVLAASIFAQSGECSHDILSVFELCLNQEWVSWINQAKQIESMPGQNTVDENLDENLLNEARKAMDKQSSQLEAMESKLRICQLACESFANMLSTEDDDLEANGSDSAQLHLAETAIKSTNLLSVLLGITETPGPELPMTGSSRLDFEWKILQSRCLGVLANMFLLMDRDFMVSCNINVADIWNRIYSVQRHDNSPESSVVECLSALTRAAPLNSITINYDHILALINDFHRIQLPEFQVHIVGILGALAQYQGNIEANKMIGDFLMDQAFKTTFSIVVMEILNVMFDIYSDKFFDYDEPVFVRGNYLSLLKKLEPILTLNLTRETGADECLENLRAFIDYKESE